MDERLRFVARLLDGEKMAALCREFDVSRKTGYKIYQRYKDCGLEGLTDRSRRPYRQANQLPLQIEKLILRLKRDVGKQSYIGLVMTSYNFIEKHNQLLGIDGQIKISKQKTFRFQVAGSTSRRCFFEPALDAHRPGPSEGCFVGFDPAPKDPNRPGETNNYYRTGNGLAYRWQYNRDGRNFYYGGNGNGQTQDYRADLGFTRRLNTNFAGAYVGYVTDQKPKAKLIRWNFNESVNTNFNWQGLSQNFNHESSVGMTFQHNTFLGFGFNNGYERLFEE